MADYAGIRGYLWRLSGDDPEVVEFHDSEIQGSIETIGRGNVFDVRRIRNDSPAAGSVQIRTDLPRELAERVKFRVNKRGELGFVR